MSDWYCHRCHDYHDDDQSCPKGEAAVSWQARAESAERERDALAAEVERLRAQIAAGVKCPNCDGKPKERDQSRSEGYWPCFVCEDRGRLHGTDEDAERYGELVKRGSLLYRIAVAALNLARSRVAIMNAGNRDDRTDARMWQSDCVDALKQLGIDENYEDDQCDASDAIDDAIDDAMRANKTDDE